MDHCLSFYIFNLFVLFIVIFPHKNSLCVIRNFHLLCLLLYHQQLEKCLANGKYSINICLINDLNIQWLCCMLVPELGGDDKKERNIDKILALMRTTGY